MATLYELAQAAGYSGGAAGWARKIERIEFDKLDSGAEHAFPGRAWAQLGRSLYGFGDVLAKAGDCLLIGNKDLQPTRALFVIEQGPSGLRLRMLQEYPPGTRHYCKDVATHQEVLSSVGAAQTSQNLQKIKQDVIAPAFVNRKPVAVLEPEDLGLDDVVDQEKVVLTVPAKQGRREHVCLKDAVLMAKAGLNLFLAGPAGSGKTTLARQVAEELGRTVEIMTFHPDMSINELFGRRVLTQAGQVYVESPLVRGCQLGSVIVLDELDACPGEVLVGANELLEDRTTVVPSTGERIHALEGTVFIACANTWGAGANAEYTRQRLDAATLNRFAGGKLFVDYDEELERSHFDPEIVRMVQAVRKAVRDKKMRKVISMRDSKNLSKLKAAGATSSFIVNQFLADWSNEDRLAIADVLKGIL